MHLIIEGSGYSRTWAGVLRKWLEAAPVEHWTVNSTGSALSTRHFALHKHDSGELERLPHGVPVVRNREWEDYMQWLPVDESGLPVWRFGDTVCWMLAEVLLWNDSHVGSEMEITDVYLPGVDLLSDRRERGVELECTNYWCGVLRGAGIGVHVHDKSALADRRLYPKY